MPAIALRQGRPCLYPDTSTLAYAFGGATIGAKADDQAIFSALCRIAEAANLCLSFTHIQELARGGSRAAADGALLDQLPIVWLLQPARAEYLELQNLLLHPAGRTPRPQLPSAASFLSQFETLAVDALPDLLRENCLAAFLAAGSEDVEHRRRLDHVASLGRSASLRLREDRQAAQQEGVSPEQLEERLDEKLLASLRQQAVAVHEDLIRNRDTRYLVANERVLSYPTEDQVGARVLLPDTAPELLPTHFVLHRVIRAAARVAANKESPGSKFFRQRDGDLFDFNHLVGAAYADGFVCDRHTSKLLGDARTQLGRPPAICFQGNKQRLADQLLAGAGL